MTEPFFNLMRNLVEVNQNKPSVQNLNKLDLEGWH